MALCFRPAWLEILLPGLGGADVLGEKGEMTES